MVNLTLFQGFIWRNGKLISHPLLISPSNRYDSTGIIKNRKSPNLFPEIVGKSPNLYYKTPLEYIIFRNVTFRYDIEQVSPISCRQDTGAGLEGHHPCGCSL